MSNSVAFGPPVLHNFHAIIKTINTISCASMLFALSWSMFIIYISVHSRKAEIVFNNNEDETFEYILRTLNIKLMQISLLDPLIIMFVIPFEQTFSIQLQLANVICDPLLLLICINTGYIGNKGLVIAIKCVLNSSYYSFWQIIYWFESSRDRHAYNYFKIVIISIEFNHLEYLTLI